MRGEGRIALVTGSLPPEVCGVGDYTARLHEALSGLMPVDLLHVPIRSPWVPDLFRVFRGRPLVHVEYPTEGWGNSVLPTFLPIAKGSSKLLLTLHEWSQMNPVRRASIRPLVREADAFVFVSALERDAFLATAPRRARSKPSWVIPIGVNLEVPDLSPDEVLQARKQTLGGDHDLLLTHFGFIHDGKQPEKLLQTVVALQKMGRRPKLVFIGDFQKDKALDRRRFVEDIDARGLADSVEMKGFVQDDREAALLMAAGDCSISLFSDGLTPRRGSFWYATQHGRPVITTVPADWREFQTLERLLQPPMVQFVEPEASGGDIARLVAAMPPYAPFELERLPVPSWREIAEQHAAVYRELVGG